MIIFKGNIKRYTSFKRISACNKIIYFIMCGFVYKNSGTKKSVVSNYDRNCRKWYKGSDRLWTAVARCDDGSCFFSFSFFRDSRKRSAAHVFGLFIFMDLKEETGLKKKEKNTHSHNVCERVCELYLSLAHAHTGQETREKGQKI